MDCMGRLQAAGSVSVWTQSVNQYLILRLQGDIRHVLDVTILEEIPDMFQLCYDIVQYLRHVSSGFWTQCM